MKEIWKDIPDFKGIYLISNLGNVKRLEHKIKKKKGLSTIKSKILNQYKSNKGYLRVSLKGNKYLVHRLVMIAFFGIDTKNPIVNHKNGNPLDNRLINLEWCTHKENIQHAISINRVKRGEDNQNAKLKNKDVLEIVKLHVSKTMNQIQLARKYNVSKGTIHSILRGKSWSSVTGIKKY